MDSHTGDFRAPWCGIKFTSVEKLRKVLPGLNMLKRFSVKNFKGFKDEISIDFTDVKNYEFNEYCLSNNLLNKAIIYGKNGSGKSNLGLAIFDIVGTLTDKARGDKQYEENYINANSREDKVEFRYEFLFNNDTISYSYGKSDFETLIYERLWINGELLVDSAPGNVSIRLPGADTLNIESDVGERISAVKYVRRNTPTLDNPVSTIFQDLFDFVDGMLFFRSLRENNYIGFTSGTSQIYDDIVKKNDLDDFQEFLHAAGIEANLVAHNFGDKQTIGIWFESGKILRFGSLSSTGTSALSLFYFWSRELSKVKFLFVDEFDAYYHHELSEFVAKKILGHKCQSILTTHNTSLMNNNLFRPDACLIVDKNVVEPVFRRTSKELREVHNLEKIYVSGGFDKSK